MVLKMGTAMGCRNRCFSSIILFLFCFLSTLLCPGIAPAQAPTVARAGAHGQIMGRVNDSDGSPLRLQSTVTLRSTTCLTNISKNTPDAHYTGLTARGHVSDA